MIRLSSLVANSNGSLDREIARTAAEQKGLITWRQLLGLGLSRAGIAARVRRGLFHRLYRGVYLVGHGAADRETRYLAAVLACGEDAVLSGAAAAVVYGLLKIHAAPEVTTARNRRIRGVITHRVRTLEPSDTGTHNGIPITTVPRTLVDLASTLSLVALGRACHEAGVKHQTTGKVVMAIAARRRATGTDKLREIYEGDFRVTLSELERAFLRLLTDAGLPLPETNTDVDTFSVDCRWPEHKLTVELDSYRYHNSRHSWQRDRRREREAWQRGDQFRRYTYDEVTKEAATVAEEIETLLRGR